MRYLDALFCLGMTGSAAIAQERITPEDFLAIANGKTLTFTNLHSGSLVGIEEYLSPRLSVWRASGGECVYGEITVEEERLCFLYDYLDPEKACWWVFQQGERILVLSTSTGEIQEVTAISEEPLGCPTIPSA